MSIGSVPFGALPASNTGMRALGEKIGAMVVPQTGLKETRPESTGTLPWIEDISSSWGDRISLRTITVVVAAPADIYIFP